MTETVYLDLKIEQIYILAMPYSNKEIFNPFCTNNLLQYKLHFLSVPLQSRYQGHLEKQNNT